MTVLGTYLKTTSNANLRGMMSLFWGMLNLGRLYDIETDVSSK